MADKFVCVRVTNINDIDFSLFPFDWDLTLALVTAHPDGTVYHRHGGRTSVSPMSMEVVLRMMDRSLKRYVDDVKADTSRNHEPGPTLKALVETRLKGRIQPVHGCLHCHYVREARQELDVQSGAWSPDMFWIFPTCRTLGMTVNEQDDMRVDSVKEAGHAARAGIRVNDTIRSLGGAPVVSSSDMQWQLDAAPFEATVLDMTVERDGQPVAIQLRLPLGWKVTDPSDMVWRTSNPFTTHMRKYLPAPGFVGDWLEPPQVEDLVSGRRFGLRIRDMNHASALAGLRLGDVVLSIGHRSDFMAPDRFYRWCELMRRLNSTLEVEVLRGSRIMRIQLTGEHLNDTRIRATEVSSFGFIVQQLAGGGGLRVGAVRRDSDAWAQGVRLGRRIRAVEGETVSTLKEVRRILNAHLPGEVLSIELEGIGVVETLAIELEGTAP